MKRSDLLKAAPALAALAGIGAMFLRKQLYLTAVDATGRIVSGHPLSWALAGLTAAVAILCLLAAWKTEQPQAEKASGNASDCFSHCFFAFGIVFTVLTKAAPMAGLLGAAWKWLGIASAPCLVWMGWRQLLGEKPPVFVCILPTLFLTVHLINHYQLWCGNPQLQDVFFPLFATIALTIAAYQQAAFAANMGSRRQLLLAGWLAIFLCLAESAVYDCQILYLTGALWANSSLGAWKAV